MALIYNGNIIQSVIYNGINTTGFYNGVQVWGETQPVPPGPTPDVYFTPSTPAITMFQQWAKGAPSPEKISESNVINTPTTFKISLDCTSLNNNWYSSNCYFSLYGTSTVQSSNLIETISVPSNGNMFGISDEYTITINKTGNSLALAIGIDAASTLSVNPNYSVNGLVRINIIPVN